MHGKDISSVSEGSLDDTNATTVKEDIKFSSQVRIQCLESKVKNLELENDELKTRNKKLKEKIRSFTFGEDYENMSQLLKEKEVEIEELTEFIKEEIKQNEMNCENYENEINQLRIEVEMKEENISRLQSELTKTFDDFKKDSSNFYIEINNLRNEKEQIEEQYHSKIKQLKSDIIELTDIKNNLEKSIREIKEANSKHIDKLIEKYKSESKTKEENQKRITKEFSDLKEKFVSYEKENKLLKQKLYNSSEKEKCNKGSVFKSIIVKKCPQDQIKKNKTCERTSEHQLAKGMDLQKKATQSRNEQLRKKFSCEIRNFSSLHERREKSCTPKGVIHRIIETSKPSLYSINVSQENMKYKKEIEELKKVNKELTEKIESSYSYKLKKAVSNSLYSSIVRVSSISNYYFEKLCNVLSTAD